MTEEKRDSPRGERERRLAAALRDNLRKRKAQARVRRTADTADGDAGADGGAEAGGASQPPKSAG